ncbi:hypothetical protein CBP51_11060 [Cellvibrio mixtus]|uniref:Peptidase A2 domain-containing protein n=1 Tax=Cellvibrio mixtus TaxID=39650 RepID=A0A266QC86_9GAMM|nr:filamentous hemagglutinin N-terminal domain-containing protein [Cellvibrio mixtus]OZY87482.1 hypothetical protein CBP51_11060 [Cellvibrio mixtus]
MSSTTLPKRFASISRQPQLSRQKLYAAMLIASQWMAASPLWAAPEGGEVVGGEGVITQNGVDTLIHQASDRLAIDWRSFDVAANERVEFIQPSSSSIALNRVLSNSASHILGRIDSNGQVMLVNPNGVVFGKDAIINVGGMIASGMSIDPASFINGDFTLNSLEGTDGKVINYGIINAATGGSVTLVGQQVQNNGLISAKLGAVNLAAGNEAVLTFDPSGLVGVKVTEAVLQQALGVDAAVINNGTINADGGRVLLSASVSEDIFSDAVNNGGMNKTSSVVMHEDGSFTLGAGADVINTGHIDTSVANGAAGKVVVVGNKVTTSGTITANTGSGTAGAIELHSTDTTLVTESGAISAQATTQGHGGDIKVLGNKVGLLDNAQVNASGANGGGQVLIGGDKTGQNLQIRNADFIYLGKDSSVKTDALINGNGGKLITFASDTARIYGNLYSRGGSEGGNGGFIETSGLKGFEILNTPDITAAAGFGGTWLIDPYDIVIKSATNTGINTNQKTFTSIGTATLGISNITSALDNGSTVIVQTGSGGGDDGNITLEEELKFDFSTDATLRLLAHNDIILNKSIQRKNDNVTGTLNLELIANKDNVGGGNITITNGVNIATNGGHFYAGKSAAEIDGRLDDDYTNKVVDFTSTGATIDTYGAFGGGDIVINAKNNVSLGVLKFGYDYLNAYKKQDNSTNVANLVRVGSVSVNAGGDVTLGGAIDFNNTGKRKNNGEKGYIDNTLVGEDTSLKINALGNITIDALISDAGYGDARDALDIDLTAGNAITINAGIYTAGGNFTTSSQTFNSSGRLINTDRANSNPSDTITDVNGNGIQNGNAQWSNGGNITINAASTVTLGSLVTDAVAEKGERQGNLIIQGINQTDGILTDSLTVTQSGSLDIAGTSTFNLGTGGNITLLDDDNSFVGSLSFVSANNVKLKNTKATVLDDSEITGTFNLVSDGISQDEGKKLIIGGNTLLNAGTKNIVFNGTVNSTELTAANLTLIGGDISFANAVGGIKRLGEFTITSTGEVKFQSIDATPAVAQDISAKSLSVTAAKSFISGNITTAGGDVDITASDSIIVQSINTSADTAGKIALTVNGNGDEKSITINGDLNAQNTDGSQNDVVLTLKDTSAAGTINLKHTSFFSSDVTLTGLGEKNTLNALDVDNTWELTADNAGTITGNTNSKKITFSGFENINGGSEGDAFIVKNNSKFTGLIDGGAGANSLNIADESNTDAYAIAVANIYDENASLTVKGITTIVGNNHNDTSLIIASGNNEWIIDGIDKGMVSLVSFEQIKNLMGGEGNDSFKFGAAGQITGSINGGLGNNSITAREADTLWMINGENSGSLSLASEVATRYLESFSNVQHLIGTAANDTFTFTDGAKVDSANGNGGFDTADLSQITTDITVTIDKTSEYGFTSVEKIIANENANFTLEAISGDNNWSIDSSNAGQVNGIQFVDFKILQGGTDSDTFTIDADFAGSIYGGDGDDTFNIKAQVGSIFGGDGADTFNIHALVNNKAQVGSIFGGDGADTFNINAHVNNIFGGDGDDRFVFFEGGSVTTASGDDGYDIVDFSNLTAARIITLNGTSINNVDSVSRVIANSTYDFTLEATSGNNIWRIYDFDGSGTAADGTNDGLVNGIQFVDFKILKGGSGIDTFTIDTNFKGTIYGVAGNNVFNVNANVNTIYGGDENDSFVLGNSGSVTTLNGGLGTNTLTGRNNNNVWTLTADNTGSLSTGNTTYINNFSNIQVLQGGNAVDIFNLDFAFSGTVKGGAGADIFNVNAETNILDGEDGNDSFRFNSDSNIGSANVIHGGDGNNDISGRETINTWEITSTNTGSVSVTSGTTYIASFNNIQTLNGGAAADDFIINASIGTIQSGAGNNTFYVNTAVGHLQGGADNDHFIFGAAGSAQSIIGAGGVNSLTGRNANNTWNITGAHAGNLGVTGAGLYVTNFSNIQNLQGGNSIDIFNINAIAGSVFGNAGNDQFVFNSNNNAGSAALIDGGADNNILIGRNAENTWTMLGANNGTLSTTNGTNYVANFSAIQQLEGGNAVDSLVAINQDNDWNITGVNRGNLGASGSTSFITFTNIENLIGRQALDRFTFTSNQSYITGLIDGGSSATLASIQDSLDLTAVTSGVTVELGNSSSNHLNVVNIESITAYTGNPNNNVIIGASDSAYRWNITSLNAGSIERITSPSLETSVNFNNFGELRGGTNSDRFNVQAQVSKSISGGEGEGIDLVDYSNRTEDVAITIGGNGSLGVTGINGIEGIIGNSGVNSAYNSTINVTDGNNTWTIGAFDSFSDGINDGTININGKIISFENFNRLIGGSGNDTFNYSALGQLKGLIDGGAGDNIVNASQSTKAQQFHVNGNELGATNIVRIKELIGNLSTNSVLVSQSSSNIWNINNQGIGRLNDSLRFSGITNLKGEVM